MSHVSMQRVEAVTRRILALVEALNSGDSSAAADLLSNDRVLDAAEPPPFGKVYQKKKAVLEYLDRFCRTVHVQIKDLWGAGFNGAARLKLRRRDAADNDEPLRESYSSEFAGAISEAALYVKGMLD